MLLNINADLPDYVVRIVMLESCDIHVHASISLAAAKSSTDIELKREERDDFGRRFFSLPSTQWGGEPGI